MSINKMLGCDLSHHNYGVINPSYVNFVMLKATEGATYEDPAMDKYLRDIQLSTQLDNMPFIGFYHFARPYKNTYLTEAKHFLNKIKPHIGNCLIALDWENVAHNIPNAEQWAMQWLGYVYKETGTMPLFYCSQAYLHNYPIILETIPIWVAHYHKQDNEDNCEKYTMWQITSNPFDIDLFNGAPSDMIKLIKGKKV